MTEDATRTTDRPPGYEDLDVFSQAIADEALRRGISVEVLDPEMKEMALSRGGRHVTTIQSLSDLTSAVAFRRCSDKIHSRRVLERAGLHVPAARVATFDEEDAAFLDEWKEIVVKPARGEQGAGVTARVVDHDRLATALDSAREVCPTVLLEQRCRGEDVRVLVIGGEVEGAIVRRPPTITGDGRRTVRELIEERSRERAEATDGASHIPVGDETLEVVRENGFDLETVLAEGKDLTVRSNANVHTGGTSDNITATLHPHLAEVAVKAAEATGCPVAGVDLMVPAVDGPDYVIIEVNEQPGLSADSEHHAVKRFVDLLFPDSDR